MPASTCCRRGRPSPGCNAARHRLWPGALRQAATAGQGARGILAELLAQLQAQVEYLSDQLIAGVREGRYVAEPWLLFEVRIALAEAAQQAVQLELQARRRGLPEAGRRWLGAALARGRLPAHRHAQPGAAEDRAGCRARLAAEAAA